MIVNTVNRLCLVILPIPLICFSILKFRCGPLCNLQIVYRYASRHPASFHRTQSCFCDLPRKSAEADRLGHEAQRLPPNFRSLYLTWFASKQTHMMCVRGELLPVAHVHTAGYSYFADTFYEHYFTLARGPHCGDVPHYISARGDGERWHWGFATYFMKNSFTAKIHFIHLRFGYRFFKKNSFITKKNLSAELMLE